MTPEKIIENQILSFLWSNNFFCWKTDRQGTYDPVRKTFRKNWNPYKIKGVSDILGITASGKLFAIEVKTKKGRLSDDQQDFLSKINANNGIGIVARSLQDVIEFFENRKAKNEEE